jgi:pyridoxal phosphate enzyme (YggS family)
VSRADDIAAGIAAARARIARAEKAAGRPAGSAKLVAVSKTMPPADVEAALATGQLDFGENYAQELRDKRGAVKGTCRWHFIGPLQRNKVKYVAGNVALVHSVDNLDLLAEIDRRMGSATPAGVQDCLLQVNVAGEEQKRGAPPAAVSDLLDRFATLPHVRCLGLMLIPPASDDPEAARPHFAALRRLRDEHAARQRDNVDLRELSMGMSHDLEVAVAEGATLVRVGTAIFGARGA